MCKTKIKEFICEKKEQLFDGEFTFPKIIFWLITVNVFLLGILYGLFKAPLTHGLSIRCGNNNGNNCGNNNGEKHCTCDDCDDDECECVGCCECDEEDE